MKTSPYLLGQPVVLGLCLIASLFIARPVSAHPLGNDTVSHFSVIYILPDRFELDLLLDIAETPSAVYRRDEIDTDHDDDDTVAEQNAWLDRKAGELAGLLRVTLDARPLPLAPLAEAFDPRTGQKAEASRVIIKQPGFGGMPTYRMMVRYGARYPAPLDAAEHTITYVDGTFESVPGLRRVLLEETSVASTKAVTLAELKAVVASQPAGTPSLLPRSLRSVLDQKKAGIGAQARLDAAPDADTLRLLDADRCFAIAETDIGLAIFRSPFVQIIPPRPSYWSEGSDPFLWDQYDPSALPQEKSATIRFQLRTPCPAPGAAAATSDSATSSPSAASQPATMPAFVKKWTDPRNDPARASEYYRQADTLVGMLREMNSGRGFMLFLTITVLAFVWGAGHALMPGHAKTVVAAYLISQRGTYWHAVLLAIVVTVTHTALVVIVGFIVFAYQRTHPNLGPQIQLWLGTLAGALVSIMGLTLIWRAATGRIVHHHHDHDHHHHEDLPWWRRLFTHSHAHVGHRHHHHHHGHSHSHGHHHGHGHSHHHHDHSHDHGHDHSHDHGHAHSHDHHGDTHSHDHRDHREAEGTRQLVDAASSSTTNPAPAGAPHDHHHHASAEPISTRMLLMLGITGGIVPCPTAMIILLLGIGANVVAWSLYAVGVFSLGLSLTLMGIGFLALASRRFATRLLSDAEHEGEMTTTGQRLMFQVIPALSGLAVVVLGGMIAANYLHMMRVGQPLFPWLG